MVAAGSVLGVDSKRLDDQSCLLTAEEIAQQPEVWRATLATVDEQLAALNAWLVKSLGESTYRIVLTGAGSSAYIGEVLAPWLGCRLCQRVEAIPTTDIVVSPSLLAAEDVPTLLVSFARSGDSPESVAAFELAEQHLSLCAHLIVTCNAAGALAAAAERVDRSFCLIMPPQANDRSLAMTSSFTAMLVAAAHALGCANEEINRAATGVAKMFETRLVDIQAVADANFDRLLVIGDGPIGGAAKECALKMLELTDGKVAALAESTLGVRHGPKAFISEATLVLVLSSTDAYVAAYERDIVAEIRSDGRALDLHVLEFPENPKSELEAALLAVVHGQLLGFFKTLSMGLSADSPSSSGQINRVVQGVTIYPYSTARDGAPS